MTDWEGLGKAKMAREFITTIIQTERKIVSSKGKFVGGVWGRDETLVSAVKCEEEGLDEEEEECITASRILEKHRKRNQLEGR